MKQYIFDQFVNNIINHTGLTREQLFSNTKRSDSSNARKVLFKLCRDRGISNKSIENYMNENGYTCHNNTIRQALSSLELMISNDPDIAVIIKKLSSVEV
mgnify:CR=1 FL=1|tara:strand:- start:97 stop:396 length:300 start_codon:yes stop_codon:yes gene_type:complete